MHSEIKEHWKSCLGKDVYFSIFDACHIISNFNRLDEEFLGYTRVNKIYEMSVAIGFLVGNCNFRKNSKNRTAKKVETSSLFMMI